MLIWMCALHCEAKPLIDYYRLQKSAVTGEFDVYQNDSQLCIVSGIGAIKMSTATTWAAHQHRIQANPYWINLGIAGHKTRPPGSTVIATKITSSQEPGEYNAVNNMKLEFYRHEVISFPTQPSDYPDSAVCDMEAFAFFKTASQYSPISRCHSIKIISDNATSPAHRDKAKISALIAANMKAISQFANDVEQTSETGR